MTAPLHLHQLQDATNRLLDEVSSRYGPTINLDEHPELLQQYSNVELRAAHADRPVTKDDLELGDHGDDIEEVLDVNHPEHTIALWHDLSHLAGVLMALAYIDLPPDPDDRLGSPTP